MNTCTSSYQIHSKIKSSNRLGSEHICFANRDLTRNAPSFFANRDLTRKASDCSDSVDNLFAKQTLRANQQKAQRQHIGKPDFDAAAHEWA